MANGKCAGIVYSISMNKLKTNRDLYLAIVALCKEHADREVSLEEYLIALYELGARLKHLPSIQLDEFFALLHDAFSASPMTYDVSWGDKYDIYTDQSGYKGWLTTITSQIVDLHELRLAGAYQNEMRYFGMQSPRKGYWVNFDPGGFLECAITGSLGGWMPEDDSGRCYVPGPVAVLDEHGNIVTKNPEDIPNPIYELPEVTWDVFKDLLQSGQMYE